MEVSTTAIQLYHNMYGGTFSSIHKYFQNCTITAVPVQFFVTFLVSNCTFGYVKFAFELHSNQPNLT